MRAIWSMLASCNFLICDVTSDSLVALEVTVALTSLLCWAGRQVA